MSRPTTRKTVAKATAVSPARSAIGPRANSQPARASGTITAASQYGASTSPELNRTELTTNGHGPQIDERRLSEHHRGYAEHHSRPPTPVRTYRQRQQDQRHRPALMQVQRTGYQERAGGDDEEQHRRVPLEAVRRGAFESRQHRDEASREEDEQQDLCASRAEGGDRPRLERLPDGSHGGRREVPLGLERHRDVVV